MKETVLNALLQLFAIIANVSQDGVSFKARSIVKTFLRQHLKTNSINKYLVVFDHYLEIHHPHLFAGGVTKEEGTLSDSAKLGRIANEINQSLLQREKFIVFLRLVEFINEDDVMTDKELVFIRLVADSFNISPQEQNNTRAFVLNSCDEIEKDKLLVLDDKDHPFIEGRLAFLHHKSTDTFIVRYLGNMNLFLNGQNIIPERIELMENGSLITGSTINPVYYSDISRKFHYTEEAPKIFFVAEDIEYQFKNSTKGIKKFSFSKESGNLIGIMGGSGAGKSTLLNILCGKLKPKGGRITINGIDIHQEKAKTHGIIGFVPQDDLLLEELTVFRNLYLNAKLCLSNYSETEILRKINQILIDLDLEDTRHLKVGNPLKKFISGGQRKRLNIALELIREPAVLFVDEPTSGLSSMGSEKVMLLLKEQALKGRLVIVNIHQPYSDIYKLFDRFMILDKEGHVVYKGHPIDAITYFKSLSNYVNADVGHCASCGNVMPEEILKMVEAKEVDEYGKATKERKVAPSEWYDLYHEKIESKQNIVSVESPLPLIDFHIPKTLNQFGIFSLRNILSKLANRQYLLLTFLEAPLLALIIGFFTRYTPDMLVSSNYTFRENMNLFACLFIGVVVAIFMGLMSSAEEIIQDRKILERESFLRLSKLSYLHSKILTLFLISAIQTFTFVIIGTSILEIKGMLFPFWAIMFSISCLANMIGLNISSGLNSVVSAYIIIPMLIVPQFLFSGVTIKFDKLNNIIKHPEYVPIIGEIMPTRWAYEAVAVYQFKKNKFNRELYEFDRRIKNAEYNRDYLIAELRAKLDQINFQQAKGLDLSQSQDELDLLRKEIQKLSASGIAGSFEAIDKLNSDLFDESVYVAAKNYLDVAGEKYLNIRTRAIQQKETKNAELITKWGGKEAYNRMKDTHTNKRLEEILTNKQQVRGVIEWNGELIRKTGLIYMEPLSRTGRAHFYAPDKRIGKLYIDTYWFNFFVIWLFALIFYLSLVFDLLRKISDWNHVRQLRGRK